MFYRDMIMDLIHFAEKNFWSVTYNEVGTQILEGYDKLGMIMVYTFTLIVYVATFNYIFAPFFGIVTVFAYAALTLSFNMSFKFSRKTMLYSKEDFFFTFYYRASRNKRDREDSTIQIVDRFSISFTVLWNYLCYTGNSKLLILFFKFILYLYCIY